jgi:hypothetical protein
MQNNFLSDRPTLDLDSKTRITQSIVMLPASLLCFIKNQTKKLFFQKEKKYIYIYMKTKVAFDVQSPVSNLTHTTFMY